MGTHEPDYDELQVSYFQSPLLAGGAPLLRDLALSHIGVRWEALPLGPNTTCLRLLEDLREVRSYTPSTVDFVQSLRQMPHLESLELHGFLPSMESSYVAHHATFAFPSGFKSLKLSDSCDRLAHFFLFARVLGKVLITVTFFQAEFDEDDFHHVLEHLKPSVGVGRASALVEKFFDQCCSASFHFNECEQENSTTGEDSDRCLGSITLECGRGPTHTLEPKAYYSTITHVYDLQSLCSLDFHTASTKRFDDETWSYFHHAPLLRSITFFRSPFHTFILHLKNDPPLSGARCTVLLFPCLNLPPVQIRFLPRPWQGRFLP